jgi:hypothetical protein
MSAMQSLARPSEALTMQTKYLALDYCDQIKFKHAHCETCNESRLFRGWKCTHCGVMEKIRTPKGEVARFGKKTPFFVKKKRVELRHWRINTERAAHFHKLAEESRAKFEGKK